MRIPFEKEMLNCEGGLKPKAPPNNRLKAYYPDFVFLFNLPEDEATFFTAPAHCENLYKIAVS